MFGWIQEKVSGLFGRRPDNKKEDAEREGSKVKVRDGAVMDRIPLSQLIVLVTDELRKAEDLAKQHDDHIMQFEECELEMAVEVETGGTVEANVYVFTLGGERTRTNSNTITVRFGKLAGRPPIAFPTQTGGKGLDLSRGRRRGGEGDE